MPSGSVFVGLTRSLLGGIRWRVQCRAERAWLWDQVEQAPQAWFEARRISRLKIGGVLQALGTKRLLKGEKMNCRQTCFGETTPMRIKPQTCLWSTDQQNI